MQVIKHVLKGVSYPFNLEKVILFKSDSYEKCLKFLAKEIESKNNPDAYYFSVQSKNHDIYEVYSAKGIALHQYSPMSKLNDHFLGNDDPEFSEGDIVEVIVGQEVHLGFVTSTPPTSAWVKSKDFKFDSGDNCYLVDFSEDTNEHAHPRTYEIRKPSFPVSDSTTKFLNSCYQKIKSGKND